MRQCVSCGVDVDTRPGLAWQISGESLGGYACAECITTPLSMMNVFDTQMDQTHNPATWERITWLVIPKRTRTFQVWHCKPELDARGRVVGIKGSFGMGATLWPDHYTLVAEVHVHNLEQVFEATNHIDHPWNENECVTMRTTQKVRSTSVQDVVREVPVPRRPVIWAVASVGYRPLAGHHEHVIVPPMSAMAGIEE